MGVTAMKYTTDQQTRIDEARKEAQVAISSNCCPKCGWQVRRNLSLTGWVQCGQFGAVGFRDDSNLPSCDWQGFTS